MASQLDFMSPLYLGEDKISLSVDPTTQPPTAGRPVTINFDYTDADEAGGLIVPLVFTVQPPGTEGLGYVRRVFTRTRPIGYTFTAREAGTHFLLLKESAHNQWQGRLLIEVVGEKFSRITINERA